jgi:hypothetical protein
MSRLYRSDPALCSAQRDAPDEFASLLSRKGTDWESSVMERMMSDERREVIDLSDAASRAQYSKRRPLFFERFT